VGHTGCIRPKNWEYKIKESPLTRAHRLKGILPPDSMDWRNYNGHNWMTPAKSQGSCGSCWAFAAIGVIEARLKIMDN
jgi:cathepsin C